MGEKGGFRRPPRRTILEKDAVIRFGGIVSPKELEGPWNDPGILTTLTGGNTNLEPMWQEAIILAGIIPDYSGSSRMQNKFRRELEVFGSHIKVARSGIGYPGVKVDDPQTTETVDLGLKVGALFAADKTLQAMVNDASSRTQGENILRFHDLARKAFFQRIDFKKRGIALKDMQDPAGLMDTSGLSQWYRLIGDAQRALVNPSQLSINQMSQNVPDQFLQVARIIMHFSLADKDVFIHGGTREVKAASREAVDFSNKLQMLRSKTLEAFLDRDHPEHLGVVEAVSQTIASRDPRIRRATMIYLRGDKMPIELYREAERVSRESSGLEQETFLNLMGEIDTAVHENFPEYIVASREFDLITLPNKTATYRVDMPMLQRKASEILKLTGGLSHAIDPETFRWGAFKVPTEASFKVLKSQKNGNIISFEMKFHTQQGDKKLLVLLDPAKGIIDFRHVLSVSEDQAEFVGAFYDLLSRVVDRVRTDLGRNDGRTKELRADLNDDAAQITVPAKRPNSASKVDEISTPAQQPVAPERFRQQIVMPTPEELDVLCEGLTSQERLGYISKLEYAIKGGLTPKALRLEDAFSPEGNRQFELKFRVGSNGGRIILELVKGQSGVETLKVTSFRRKTEMSAMRTRNGRRRLKKS